MKALVDVGVVAGTIDDLGGTGIAVSQSVADAGAARRAGSRGRTGRRDIRKASDLSGRSTRHPWSHQRHVNVSLQQLTW